MTSIPPFTESAILEANSQRRSNELVNFGILVAACLVISALFKSCFLSVLFWLISMVPHEVGHALIHWWAGVIAVPTMLASVQFSNGRSIIFILILTALTVWSYRYSSKHNLKALSFLAGLSLLMQFIFTLFLPLDLIDELVILGGQGGELWLSAVLIILFFHPMPKRFNWRVNRYVISGLALIAFIQATTLWFSASSDLSVLPFGAALDLNAATGGNSQGDLDRLIRDYGWKAEQIAAFYLNVSLICISAILGQIGFLLIKGKGGAVVVNK